MGAIIITTSKPTTASPLGTYKVIDEQGIYWGCWKVVRTWTNEIAVIAYYN